MGQGKSGLSKDSAGESGNKKIKQEKDNHLSHCFSDFSPNLVCGKQQTNSVPE